MAEARTSIRESIGEIEGHRVVISFLIAIVPSIVAFFELAMATRSPSIWHLILPLIGFTYLLYRYERNRNKTASMLFYLAVLAFLAPISVLISAFVYASEQTNSFGQMGAVFGGGIAVVVTAIAGFFIGVVLYLISKRVAVERVETVN